MRHSISGLLCVICLLLLQSCPNYEDNLIYPLDYIEQTGTNTESPPHMRDKIASLDRDTAFDADLLPTQYNNSNATDASEHDKQTFVEPESHPSMQDGENPFDEKETPEANPSYPFFGTWHLQKIALVTAEVGERYANYVPFDEEEYIGYEIEYADEYYRIGEQIYDSPSYTTKIKTLLEYNYGGNFRPGVFDFIYDEDIIVDHSDEYEYLSDVPIMYFTVRVKDNQDLPVGAQFIMLNSDALLLGLAGKVVYAVRVS